MDYSSREREVGVPLIRIARCFAVCLLAAVICVARDSAKSLAAPLQTTTIDGWQEFSPGESGFLALLPGKPKEIKAQVQIGGQTFKPRTYELHAGANDYAVSYFDVPQPSEPQPSKPLFDGLRDALLTKFQAQLLSEQAGQFQGHPAHALKLANAQGDTIQALLCLVGQKFYSVSVKTTRAADEAQAGHAEADRFIGSIKLRLADRFGVREVDELLNTEHILSPTEGKAKGVVYGKMLAPMQIAYPALAKAARAAGTIVVSVVIDEDGNVIAAQSQAGHPLLIPSVLTAVRGVRFSPSILDGKPIKVWVFVFYNFVLA